MNQADTLKEVIKKYKLQMPMEPYQKKLLNDSKKRTYIRILKKHGLYFTILLPVISFLYWVKKFGITLSLAKSALIVGAAALITAGVVTGGSFYIVKEVILKKPENIEKKINKNVDSNTNKNPVDKKDKTRASEKPSFLSGQVTYRIGIIPFKFDGDKKIASAALQEILSNIRRIKGKNSAAVFDLSSMGKRVSKKLTGTLIKLGGSYRISIKLIDLKNSKIELYTSETAKRENDLANACKKLAVKIAKKI